MISRAKQHAEIADHISRFGWHCLHVHPNKPEQTFFTYSIGFRTTYTAPDVLIFGVDSKKAHGLLTECATVLATGAKLRLMVREDRVLAAPYDVVLKPLRSDCVAYYCGTACRYYERDDLDAVVMLLPDRENRFPWELGYDGMDQTEALSII